MQLLFAKFFQKTLSFKKKYQIVYNVLISDDKEIKSKVTHAHVLFAYVIFYHNDKMK